MRKPLLLAVCLLMGLVLNACNESPGEFDRMITGIAGGGSGGSSAPAQPAPGAQAPATGAAKMLQDPEATESSTEDYVWADSKATARSMCERTAQRNGWRLDDVQLAGGIALQTGKKRYTCRWTIFGAPK